MLTMAQKVLPSNPKDGAIIAVPQTESNFSSSCSVKTFFEGVGLEPRAFHMHTATEYITCQVGPNGLNCWINDWEICVT